MGQVLSFFIGNTASDNFHDACIERYRKERKKTRQSAVQDKLENTVISGFHHGIWCQSFTEKFRMKRNNEVESRHHDPIVEMKSQLSLQTQSVSDLLLDHGSSDFIEKFDTDSGYGTNVDHKPFNKTLKTNSSNEVASLPLITPPRKNSDPAAAPTSVWTMIQSGTYLASVTAKKSAMTIKKTSQTGEVQQDAAEMKTGDSLCDDNNCDDKTEKFENKHVDFLEPLEIPDKPDETN